MSCSTETGGFSGEVAGTCAVPWEGAFRGACARTTGVVPSITTVRRRAYLVMIGDDSSAQLRIASSHHPVELVRTRRRGRRRAGWFLRRGCRLSRSGRATANNLDVNNLHRTKRTVIAGVGSLVRDLFHQFHAGFITLAEDGVAPVEMRLGDLRDEELRAVGSRTGVGIGESAGLVEQQVGGNLVLEIDPDVARPIAFGIATLDHEVGNHAMKDSPVVERHAMLGGSANRILPVLRPRG